MPAEHLGRLAFYRGPVRGFLLLSVCRPLPIVAPHPPGGRAQRGPQGRDPRQLEVPHRKRNGNVHRLPAARRDPIRAAILSRPGRGRHVEIYPEAVRLAGGQIERHCTQPCALERFAGHRMLKRDQRVGVPARLEVLVSVRAHGQLQLVLPEQPRVGGTEHRPAGSLEIGCLDANSLNGGVAADQDLKTLPLVPGGGQDHRSALPGRLVAEHPSGFRDGPDPPIGIRPIGRHDGCGGQHDKTKMRVHLASPVDQDSTGSGLSAGGHGSAAGRHPFYSPPMPAESRAKSGRPQRAESGIGQ